jgi:hypothetical protein
VNAYMNEASRPAPGQEAGGSVGVDSWPEQLAVRLFALLARSKAVSKLIRRVAFAVIASVAFAAFRLAIEQQVQQQNSATQRVYWVVLVGAAAVVALGILRALGAVRRAARAISNFEQPYRALHASERQRHEQALRDWEAAVQQHPAPHLLQWAMLPVKDRRSARCR